MPKETIGLHSKRNWYQLIDHTADTGFLVRGNSLRELFEHAGFALFDIMADLKDVSADQARDIEVNAGDRVSLMVDWLSELNYLFFTEGLIFSDFEVIDISENHLHAQVKGERYLPERHIVHTEIKAVTYHGMYIRTDEEKWEARIILDL